MGTTIKHLIDWKFWDNDEIQKVFELSRLVKNQRWQFQGALQGRTLAMLFQKTSTRTRVSFESGMTELGGHAINLDWQSTNFTLTKISYETRYISRNVALIMARLKNHEDLIEMRNAATVPVINGCCNLYHPCQALADMLTIAEDRNADLAGTRLTYLGVYNNVVNSLLSIGTALGVHITLVCPALSNEQAMDIETRQRALDAGLLVETLDARSAVADADYVYTDTWLDMEYFNHPDYQDEKRRRIETMLPFQINDELLAASRAKIMHDMPIHPGYEIAENLVEDPRSLIYDQAENRINVQKAIMLYLLNEI